MWVRRNEIHICYPHGEHIIAIIIPFITIGASSFDDLIKIIVLVFILTGYPWSSCYRYFKKNLGTADPFSVPFGIV